MQRIQLFVANVSLSLPSRRWTSASPSTRESTKGLSPPAMTSTSTRPLQRASLSSWVSLPDRSSISTPSKRRPVNSSMKRYYSSFLLDIFALHWKTIVGATLKAARLIPRYVPENSVVGAFPRPCLVAVHSLLAHRVNLRSRFNGIVCNGIPN